MRPKHHLPKTACPACGELILTRLLSSHLETRECRQATRNLGAHRSIIELGLIRTAAELTPGVTFVFDSPEGPLNGSYTYDWVLGISGHLGETGMVTNSDALLRTLYAMQRHRAFPKLQEAPPGVAREEMAFGVFLESLPDPARQRFYLARASRLAGVIQELQLRRLVGSTET